MQNFLVSLGMWVVCMTLPALVPNMFGHADEATSFRASIAFGPMLALGVKQYVQHRRARTTT